MRASCTVHYAMAVGAWVSVASHAMGQTSQTMSGIQNPQGSGLVGTSTLGQSQSQGLAPAGRPVFGDRPAGLGFRPNPSSGRPVLLRQGGLQDAMKAARLSPLYPVAAEASAVSNVDPELTQAVQSLRNLQEVRSRQLAAQSANRGKASPTVIHTVGVALTPPSADLAAIQSRLTTILENYGHVVGDFRLRQEGQATVLEGTVESAAQRSVVEQLVRLEPGVYDLKNRLQVTSPALQP